jgi:D-glycero-D-manno-heptose 1,7-bisphosphate phosphatase
MKVLLLDKDGTLVNPLSGGEFPKNPEDQELLPGVAESVEAFSKAGWVIHIVSNQGGVEAGFKSLEFAIAEMKYCLGLLPKVESAYFCPNGLTDTWWRTTLSNLGLKRSVCYKVMRKTEPLMLHESICDEDMILATGARWGRPVSYRKPSGLMLFLAALDSSYMSAEKFPETVLMVGDREEDKLAAVDHMGCLFMDAAQWREGGYKDLLKEKEHD